MSNERDEPPFKNPQATGMAAGHRKIEKPSGVGKRKKNQVVCEPCKNHQENVEHIRTETRN